MTTGVATPEPITEAFGINAGGGFITDPIPLTTVTPGAASFDQGFPQACFLALSAGGTPPSGKDFNGILKMVTAYCAAIQAGQYPAYNSVVSALIGGYNKGSLLQRADGLGYWLSTTNANTTDPDTGGAGWVILGGLTTPVTVSALPGAPPAGSRAMVTDATLTTFASAVIGGGANTVPVFWNGAAWAIG